MGVAIPEQYMPALQKANDYRFRVAAERRRIASLPMAEGQEELAKIIESEDDPALHSGRIVHWLMAPQRRGEKAARRLVRDMNVQQHGARVRHLTRRQKNILADAIRNDYRIVERSKVAA